MSTLTAPIPFAGLPEAAVSDAENPRHDPRFRALWLRDLVTHWGEGIRSRSDPPGDRGTAQWDRWHETNANLAAAEAQVEKMRYVLAKLDKWDMLSGDILSDGPYFAGIIHDALSDLRQDR